MSYTYEIKQDEYPVDSPRDWDNLGTMVCWHSRYTLGDEQPNDSPDAYQTWLVYDYLSASDQYEIDTTIGWADYTTEYIPDDTKDRIEKLLEKHFVILPLYLYDHGGITISTGGFSCPWDSGQVGFIYASRDDILKEYSCERMSKQVREKVIRLLKAEVNTYDQYLTGDVWGYVISDENEEEVDSCWGFYGYDYCESDAQNTIQWLEAKDKENQQETQQENQ